MADLPPSYEEVVKNPPIRRDASSAIPSAPPLDTIASHLHSDQEQTSQPGLPYPYAEDGRFNAWDDRATKILVVNRLDMNERFDKARNQLERHLLWNVILNHILAAGYGFARIDLMQYWKHIFSIYKSIVNGLYAGTPMRTTWKYFEPMDNVFKYTTKRPKSTSEEDYDAARVALPSQPMFSIVYNGIQSEPLISPSANHDVVTTQPGSSVRERTPTAPRNNFYDDDNSSCCFCCWPCTKGKSRTTSRNTDRTTIDTGRSNRYTTRTGGYTRNRSGGYTSRTGGYTGRTGSYENISHHDNHNSIAITDTYSGLHSVNLDDTFTGGVTEHHSTACTVDDNHTSNSHTNDSICDDNRVDGSCDTGGGTITSCNDTNDGGSGIITSCNDTNDGGSGIITGCNDVGGDDVTDICSCNSDTGGNDYSCGDTGGTDYSCCDTSEVDGTDYSCCDTGEGGDTDV